METEDGPPPVAQGEVKMKRSPEIEQLSRDLVVAMEAGNLAALEQATSRQPGVVSIGSAPDEYAQGYDRIISLYRESTPDAPMHIHTRVTEVRAYEHGDVGWVDSTGTFEHDGKSVEVRTTAVVLREGDRWRAVQSHSSIGVPNDHMFDPMFRRPRANAD
jgi:SnoaL-like domain